jgi:hypothetical protein
MIQKQNQFTDEEFIETYNKLQHLGRISEHYKIPVVQVWRKCQKLGLSVKNGGNQTKIPLEEILEGKHGYYQTLKLKKRILKEGLMEHKCASCGISEWNGKDISLHLDHIDGNSSNHKFENLRLLCPNCHSQTDTYCGRNK